MVHVAKTNLSALARLPAGNLLQELKASSLLVLSLGSSLHASGAYAAARLGYCCFLLRLNTVNDSCCCVASQRWPQQAHHAAAYPVPACCMPMG